MQSCSCDELDCGGRIEPAQVHASSRAQAYAPPGDKLLPQLKLGIEVGGTFTDWLLLADTEIVASGKVLSTPEDPSVGALAALDATGADPSHIASIVHGSTVATNLILERKGSPTALLVTAGFEDVLAIQRQAKQRIFDLFYEHPVPIIPRDLILGVKERISASGLVATPIDAAETVSELHRLSRDLGVESVAISLLHSYANPAHERRLERLVREQLPELHVTTSSAVAPHFREFERTSTTVLSAYVKPAIDRYLTKFEAALSERGFTGNLEVIQANGGTLPAEAVRRHAAKMILSGPAAGVTGAAALAGLAGFEDVITLDVGGTSSDTSLVTGGRPSMTNDYQVDGLPLQLPMIDIVTVGAGGGSIAYSDAGGILHVGPRSAGSRPGPACYGMGGIEPTVTDAHVALGLIRTDVPFGGALSLDASDARRALEQLASLVSLPVEQLAFGIRQIANSTMAQALRLITVERGHDPSSYAMVAFGGGGPLHAADVADELGIATVIVPGNPGILSAFGLLIAPYHQVYEVTRVEPLDGVPPHVRDDFFEELLSQARLEFEAYGVAWEDVIVERGLDMRFEGQAYNLRLHLGGEGALPSTAELGKQFREAHRERFGHASSQRSIEVVNYCLTVSAPPQGLPTIGTSLRGEQTADVVQSVWLNGNYVDCLVLDRAALPEGVAVQGPVIIEEPTATCFVPEGWSAVPDIHGNLVLRK